MTVRLHRPYQCRAVTWLSPLHQSSGDGLEASRPLLAIGVNRPCSWWMLLTEGVDQKRPAR